MAVRSLAQSSLRQSPQLNSMLAGYQTNQFHHLETVKLGGSATSVIFSNLSRYSDYQHLQVRASTRTTNTSGFTSIQLNGDSGANYSVHWLSGRTSGIVSESTVNATAMFGYPTVQGSDTANIFSGIIFDFLDAFDTSKNKTMRYLNARPGASNPEINLVSGHWRNTAAITSITFTADSSSFAAGTRFSLYGLKAKA